jgi:pheromone a factor receptor
MDAPEDRTTPETAISTDITTPSAIILPTLAFLVCLLSIPPVITHITARNLTASVLVAGLVVVNLQNFVNALIWPSYPLDTRFDGHGLCDVEVKLYLGVGIAIVGAMASIFRQLALALDTDKPTIVTSKTQRIRTLIFEIGLCLVLPAYTMAVHTSFSQNATISLLSLDVWVPYGRVGPRMS